MAIRRFYPSRVLALLALILAACRPDEEELIQVGEALYLANCARCHQVGGRGFADVFPGLDGNPVVTLHDPVPVIQVIIHGRGAMPGFADILEDREIAAVISYIRNAWGNDAPAISPRLVSSGMERRRGDDR